jgi:hypothetical protein
VRQPGENDAQWITRVLGLGVRAPTSDPDEWRDLFDGLDSNSRLIVGLMLEQMKQAGELRIERDGTAVFRYLAPEDT